MKSATPIESIEAVIHTIRGERVILDADLAELYGVPTKALNQAIKRNAERFPQDFMFLLTQQESTDLRSQIVTANTGGRGGRRTLPYAFTEHGAIMAANVLNSKRAVEMSVYVVRAFVRMRRVLVEHKDLAARLDAVERRMGEHDESIKAIGAGRARAHDAAAQGAPPDRFHEGRSITQAWPGECQRWGKNYGRSN